MPGAPSAAPAVRILSETRCHLGEGAAYCPQSDTAWWFDILGRRLFSAQVATGAVAVEELPVMASALAVVDDTRLLVMAEDGLHLRERTGGAMTRLWAIEADDPRTRSNDARVHPSGTFWVSTMGLAAEAGLGAIYALAQGQVVRLFAGLTIPNAICFSPDGSQGFFADTGRSVLHRVPLDPATGLPTGEPVVIRRHDPAEGGLDGAVTDAAGLIWAARWGGGRVDVLTPAGEIVRRLPLPARQPSCPVFVGPSLRTLLVTSALEGLDERQRAADPDGGKTFLLEPGATGRPEPRVRLAQEGLGR